MRTVINGISLNYEITGEGKALVLTHGLGGELGNWRNVVPDLARSYRVMTWDVRGFGQSDKPEGEYSAGLFAEDLHRLLARLGIARVYLLGHSMGGVIAQRFALDYPQQVEALILVSTSSEVGPRATAAWEDRIRGIEEKGMEGITPFAGWAYAPEFAQAHPEAVEERLRVVLRNDPQAYIRATRAVSSYNYTPELARIGCPTLILQGDKDIITPPGGSVIMNRNIPGSQLKIFKDCGHMLPTEKEKEFVEAVLEFLGNLPGSQEHK